MLLINSGAVTAAGCHKPHCLPMLNCTVCMQLDPHVIRIAIVPGSDPRMAYGDLVARGVRGIVLESFGVGNMPDGNAAGWLPWLREQTRAGLYVYLASQCLQVWRPIALQHLL